MPEYEVTVYCTTQRTVRVKAKNRDEAATKASDRVERTSRTATPSGSCRVVEIEGGSDGE